MKKRNTILGEEDFFPPHFYSQVSCVSTHCPGSSDGVVKSEGPIPQIPQGRMMGFKALEAAGTTVA